LAAARNRGAREAAHPLVVFLDDDVVPVEGFLAEHARAHREVSGDRVVLGYSAPVVDGEGLWAVVLRAWWEDHFRRKAHPCHQWSFVDFVDGNVSLPRRLLWEVGGFDEGLSEGRRQDWELGIRLLAGGAEFCYRVEAKGLHRVDVRLATALSCKRSEGRADVMLAAKHPEAIAQLPLRHLGWVLGQRSGAALVRHAQRLERLRPGALRLLSIAETTGPRRYWRGLVDRLLGHSYVLGVLDALGDVERVRDYLAAAPVPPASSAVVWLDAPGGVRLPTPVAASELLIGYGGRPLASVDALEPAGHFDWEALVERIATHDGYLTQLGMALTTFTNENGNPTNGNGRARDRNSQALNGNSHLTKVNGHTNRDAARHRGITR
jgi:hypothetical protein